MNKADFFAMVSKPAIKTQIEYGVPASITMAQAAVESRYGESKLTRLAKNYFGIKANKGYTGDAFNINTGEFINGANIIENDAFRAYNNSLDSFTDHAEFLLKNKRYKGLFDTEDSYKWAEGLQKAGYATAPDYADTLKNVIRQNDLKKYDLKAAEQQTPTATITKHVRRNRTIYLVSGGLVLLTGGILTYRHYNKGK